MDLLGRRGHRAMQPGNTSILQMGQRLTDPSDTISDVNETSDNQGRGVHFLTRFVTRKASAMVAVTQRAHQFGDVRDKEKPPNFEHEGEQSATDQRDTGFGLKNDSQFLKAPLWHEGNSTYMNDFPPTPPLGFKRDIGKALNSDLEELGRMDDATPSRNATFPIQAQKKKRNGPWWGNFLPSPVRDVTLRDWRKNTTDLARASDPLENDKNMPKVPKGGRKPRGHRKDLPGSNVKTRGKPSFKLALKLLKSRDTRRELVSGIEKDFYANSSRAAKASKCKTVEGILNSAFGHAYPLDVKKLRLLAGTLKAAGYKAATAYLAEAKISHVEKGHDWSAQLDRELKLCMKAAKRGVGPRKKAPEVQEDDWAKFPLFVGNGSPITKVVLATHLFALGVHWMMREIEIAALKHTDISFDEKNRMVAIAWRSSKTDSAAQGCVRTLQCLCNDKQCDLRCPYAVLEVLCNTAKKNKNDLDYLSVTKEGLQAQKRDLVEDWQGLFGSKITGHSSRRSGALQAIRKGWTISQTAFLGRWKSNIITEYAMEALETMPVNAGGKFDKVVNLTDSDALTKVPTMTRQSSIPKDTSILETLVKSLELEVAALKKNGKSNLAKIDEEVLSLKNKIESDSRFLPSLVKSTRHGVVHANVKTLVYIQPQLWRTQCGWHFYHTAKYEFLSGTKDNLTCAKCMAIAVNMDV